MKEADLLLTIAEVAVAFAGFASLVSVLGRARGREHEVVQARRIRGMILNALMVVGFAFVPFVPHGLGLSHSAAWRVSSALLALVPLVVVGNIVAADRHLRAEGIERPRGRSPAAGALLASNLLAAEGLLVANSLGAFPTREALVYVVALLQILLIAGYLFFQVLVGFLPLDRK